MASHTVQESASSITARAIGAQRLSRYISRRRCQRFLYNILHPEEAKQLLVRYGVAPEPLSPLLSESGHSFEREIVKALSAHIEVRNFFNKTAEDFIAEVKNQPVGRSLYYQPKLEGKIGEWPCEGYADLIQINRHSDGSVDALVIDIKASRRESVGFRLQIAFYGRLLQNVLKEADLALSNTSGAVISHDSELDLENLEQFDLAIYLDEIERLIAAPDSDIARAAGVTFKTASYHLGPHCDGCPHNAVCFLDSAEREDLSLVPLIRATEKSALQAEGIRTVRELAELMRYGQGEMEIAPDRETDIERISQRWPLGSRLPILVQRARAALKRHDKSIDAKRYLLGSDWGSLPDERQYPNLVKVFIDAQRDYLEDRLYLLSGLVVGPSSSVQLFEMTDGPPDEEAEKNLLINWIQKALPAIRQIADEGLAPVHVYLYDRRGQRSLLDGLARHFEALCAIPAFYDLLTSSPALSQSMISFLGDEVRERLNLSPICQNLYEVAHALGFKWRESEIQDLPQKFRSRIFDSQRRYKRDPVTGLIERASKGNQDGMWLEASARFGTEIPLEYAYAAWGKIGETPEMEEKTRSEVRAFLGTTVEQIQSLALQRSRALRYIEESFTYKNRRVEKQPLDLSRLDEVEIDPAEVPFNRSLEDFLLLEHHAKLQDLLLHLSLPPVWRAQSGRSAILRCDSWEKTEGGEELAQFSFVNEQGEEITVDTIGILRIRVDDWVVLNPLVGDEGEFLPSWKIVRGRLATVEEMTESHLSLRLLTMSFKNSSFRFAHRIFKPEAGTLYTVDEMADDLNGDKFLDACRHAASNRLYHWLSNPDVGKKERQIRPKRLRDGKEIAELAHRAQAPHGLTEAQRSVIGDYFLDRVLVVQGPPGTGKSHTLGFAALARALALSTPARPFRIAVAARTHAAVNIALGSIARRAMDLKSAAKGDDPLLAPLTNLKVVKVCHGPNDSVSDGVERIYTDGGEELTAAEQWRMLLEEPLLVIGGTPGGLYKLIKLGAAKGRAIDWTQELFDLVIVDEASQMGIAEALTSAAFLRSDGQFIAIGDHRQMPPILAHAWDEESRRDLKRARPHLAIFDYLRELGFASAPLDQSFRIPAEIADFLQRHIYAEDGINFHSDNRKRLPGISGLQGWVEATFAPEHSLVVIEHDESGSQQANEFEATLIEELVKIANEQLGLSAQKGIGIVVPHRAQKALLRERIPLLAESIDTVERFQGGERELIIVSATVSDREFAELESNFLLEPRRLTVAISRPERKLIVISSRAVFDLIPDDLDEYERGALWKHLRHECQSLTLWEGEINNHSVSIRAAKC